MPNTSEILEFDLPPVEVTGQPQEGQGISSMKEEDFSEMISPENSAILESTVKQAIANDPEIDDQSKEMIINELSPSNILEFFSMMFKEATNSPDDEGMEEELEAESIIDGLLGAGSTDKLNDLGSPQDINFSPMGMNYGGPAKQYYNMGGATHTMPDGTVHPGATHEEYEQMLAGGMPMRMNHGGLASMGRMEDTELAHVAPGERIVPSDILGEQGNEMLDAAFIRAGLDPIEYTAGSGQQSINPMTGMPEYTSFFKRLFKKVKKLAPIIGATVGFSMGGPMGSAIGKAIGGVVKTGDLDFQRALTDFGTGWAAGNFATGMGLQGGEGFKSIFKKGVHTIKQGDTLQTIADEYGVTAQEIIDANPGAMPVEGATLKIPGGMWGIRPTSGQEGVGGFIQNAGAKLGGALGGKGAGNIDLVEQFKDLPMGKKLGVGALGLAALSQTGMFDKETRNDPPENITQGLQGVMDYNSRPLTVFNANNQPVLGQNPAQVSSPFTTSATSPRNQSLSQVLEELGRSSIGYQPSSISFS